MLQGFFSPHCAVAQHDTRRAVLMQTYTLKHMDMQIRVVQKSHTSTQLCGFMYGSTQPGWFVSLEDNGYWEHLKPTLQDSFCDISNEVGLWR